MRKGERELACPDTKTCGKRQGRGDSAHGDPRCSLDKSNQINPRKMNEIVNQNGEGKGGEDRLFPAGFALPEVKTAPDLDRNRKGGSLGRVKVTTEPELNRLVQHRSGSRLKR